MTTDDLVAQACCLGSIGVTPVPPESMAGPRGIIFEMTIRWVMLLGVNDKNFASRSLAIQRSFGNRPLIPRRL
jgi:hypothetical protein